MKFLIETVSGQKGYKTFKNDVEFSNYMLQHSHKIKNLKECDLPLTDGEKIQMPTISTGWETMDTKVFKSMTKDSPTEKDSMGFDVSEESSFTVDNKEYKNEKTSEQPQAKSEPKVSKVDNEQSSCKDNSDCDKKEKSEKSDDDNKQPKAEPKEKTDDNESSDKKEKEVDKQLEEVFRNAGIMEADGYDMYGPKSQYDGEKPCVVQYYGGAGDKQILVYDIINGTRVIVWENWHNVTENDWVVFANASTALFYQEDAGGEIIELDNIPNGIELLSEPDYEFVEREENEEFDEDDMLNESKDIKSWVKDNGLVKFNNNLVGRYTYKTGVEVSVEWNPSMGWELSTTLLGHYESQSYLYYTLPEALQRFKNEFENQMLAERDEIYDEMRNHNPQGAKKFLKNSEQPEPFENSNFFEGYDYENDPGYDGADEEELDEAVGNQNHENQGLTDDTYVWLVGSGDFYFEIPVKYGLVQNIAHSGDNEQAVRELMELEPNIKKEFGNVDIKELQNHYLHSADMVTPEEVKSKSKEELLMFFLWMAAWDLMDKDESEIEIVGPSEKQELKQKGFIVENQNYYYGEPEKHELTPDTYVWLTGNEDFYFEVPVKYEFVNNIAQPGNNEQAIRNLISQEPNIKKEVRDWSDDELRDFFAKHADMVTDEEIKNKSREDLIMFVLWLASWDLMERGEDDIDFLSITQKPNLMRQGYVVENDIKDRLRGNAQKPKWDGRTEPTGNPDTNPKFDIYVDGEYICSTKWSQTKQQAKRNYLKQYSELKPEQVVVELSESKKLNEDTVYDHSWYEVDSGDYPSRSKNGVDICKTHKVGKNNKKPFMESARKDFLKVDLKPMTTFVSSNRKLKNQKYMVVESNTAKTTMNVYENNNNYKTITVPTTTVLSLLNNPKNKIKQVRTKL